MKLAEVNGTVVRDGIGSESGFKIAATAKAFEILSSKLYSDVPRAIIRELSTNAYDAHVEAGRAETPFEVHLPNFLEPWFEIRDYGPGLSPDSVKQIYTVYFASTRTESNEFAGCLGLGSKSPFAYTNQFLVTSYVDGIAYAYSLFKNERQEPSIALLSESPTKESNGVAIRIAVKQNDFSAFIQAASKVYMHFNVKPNIKGSNDVKMTKSPAEVVGKDYEIRGGSDRYSDNALTVIMGQVAYRVGQINLEYHGFSGYDTRIDLYAKIGECQTAASREELHMDKTTIAWIEAKLRAIIEDLRQRMKDEAAKAPTTLEAVYINNLYAARTSGLSRTILLNGENPGKYSVRACEIRTDRKGRKSLMMDQTGWDMSSCRKDRPVVIIEDDCGQDEIPLKIRAKITHWFLNDPASPCGRGTGRFYVAKILDRKAFEKDFGQPVTSLSKLPDPPKAAAIAGVTMERNKSCIRAIEPYGRWENVEKFEDDEDCAVVLRNGNKVVFNDVEYGVDFLFRAMSFCGIKTVYGIPARVMKKYDGDLPEIFEFCKEKIEEKINGMTEYEEAALKQDMTTRLDTKLLNKLASINPVCKDFAEFMKAHTSLRRREETSALAEVFGVKVVDRPDYQGIFYAKYPLISHLQRNFYDEVSDTILSEIEFYIKAKGI